MSDRMRLADELETLLKALERIPRRFSTINQPSDFFASDEGTDRLDAICMVLIAVGEELKKIDRRTEGRLFTRYPNVKWRGAIGLRDVLAHGYFDVDAEELFVICKNHIPALIETVRTMIKDVRYGVAL